MNATPSGGTLNVTGCGPYTQIVTITHPMTLIGASITNATATLQSGDLEISGTSNVTVQYATVTNSTGACISADDSTNVTIQNSLMQNCVEEGYHFANVNGLVFTGNRTTGNNAAGTVDTGFEAGGGKASNCTNMVFSYNEADHNVGPGLWFDVYDNGAQVFGNRVHDNTDEGILYEISYNAHIYQNAVWENGWSNTTWVWGAGILSSTSQSVEIDHNTVAWNGDGVAAVWQNRGGPAATGISIHDNTVVQEQVTTNSGWGSAPIGFAQDDGGVIYTSGNTGAANGFWLNWAEPSWYRFQAWNGTQVQTLAQLNASPEGSGSSYYITAAQRDADLTAAGIPLTPAQ